jgi:DNA-binding transcriptional MerR regulator
MSVMAAVLSAWLRAVTDTVIPDVDVRGKYECRVAGMRIGEVAQGAGVSVRALRYYEEQNLLYPERSPSGQRHYPAAAVDRVVLIQLLYSAGLNSQAICGLLPCLHTGIATLEMIERLTHERLRIDEQVRKLCESRKRLEEIIITARNHLHLETDATQPVYPASALSVARSNERLADDHAG